MKWYRSVGIAALVAVSSAACNSSSASTLTPVAVSPTLVTESHTGTVAVGGADAYGFNVVQPGDVTVTMTAAGPPANIIMGMGIGVPSGTTCTPISSTLIAVPAGTTPQVSGSVTIAGSLCVLIFDIGNQTAPITYSITITHP